MTIAVAEGKITQRSEVDAGLVPAKPGLAVDLTVNAGPPKPGRLADTGDETGPLVAWGLLLLLGGTSLVAESLRKRRRRS